MDPTEMHRVLEGVVTTLANVGLKVIGAIILYLIGRWLIRRVIVLVQRTLERQKVDPTLLRYLGTVISVLANVALVIAILGFFGVETTSFAALLAGAGLAIGTAWGGLLGHFAAGIFMVVLRPFKVGDFVTAGGVTGTVEEIGLFSTTILSPDNVVNYVGNGKIFGDNIQNYTATPHRRVDLTAQLAHSVDPHDAIKRLRDRIEKIPNVIGKPGPDVEIGSFTDR